MLTLEGIGTSHGIVQAPVLLLQQQTQAPKMRTVDDTAAEIARVDRAIETAKTQLAALRAKTMREAGEDAAAIFEVHTTILEDANYLDAVHSMICMESLCAEYAVYSAGVQFASIFSNMADDYMKERAADVRDLSTRVCDILLQQHSDPLAGCTHPVIIAAEDLLPSQTVRLDKQKVAGFITRGGTFNSHAAILARSLGIAAVAALGSGFDRLQTGDNTIVDGIDGLVILEPDDNTVLQYAEKIAALRAEEKRLALLHGKPATTADGANIRLCANISQPEEAAAALRSDAEGIGLLRSEFLFWDEAHFPTEEVQFETYKKILLALAPRRVTIRTLDLGSDKQSPHFSFAAEKNPALGYRSVRISLDRVEDVFIPQLRALLRASVYGNLAIVFPMVTCQQEVHGILSVLARVKQGLRHDGLAYSEKLEIGIMIETPSAVMLADRFAKEVNFFCIGTNDLTQYTLAVDRMNPQVNYLFDPGSHAVLRMIQRVATCAHQAGIRVSICGESAAIPALVPYYIGMGIDELSMSAPSILRIKECIRQLNRAQCRILCETQLQ
ncbi:MAG: phosphoenolpyruvate-protein phosphotransferase system enzyme [Clostridiales bacterium]|jgi:phosphotransferase system enzyme I (PtsI)|nr:phosphoenolpyruvate--protein phosphotransferase [Pygmaiobacter sp.]MDK2813995.1 phosphoenolpyruvate-protein phosphotransferase system enzyme [Clostridiales bacterium]